MVEDDRTAFKELARICSDRGIVQITFLTDLSHKEGRHFDQPHPVGLHVVCARQVDPVTEYKQLVFFLFRSIEDRDEWVDIWLANEVEVFVGNRVPLDADFV